MPAFEDGFRVECDTFPIVSRECDRKIRPFRPGSPVDRVEPENAIVRSGSCTGFVAFADKVDGIRTPIDSRRSYDSFETYSDVETTEIFPLIERKPHIFRAENIARGSVELVDVVFDTSEEHEVLVDEWLREKLIFWIVETNIFCDGQGSDIGWGDVGKRIIGESSVSVALSYHIRTSVLTEAECVQDDIRK